MDHRLPPDVSDAMKSLTKKLTSTLGDALQSVVVYGSAARGDWKRTRSDVNVLLVLGEVTRDHLDTIAPVFREAQADILLHPMISTLEELHGAADTYPVLFFDLRRHHVVLHGRDLELPQVVESHLRLRVEQQLRDLVMNLRASYLKDRDYPKRLALSLESQASGALAVFEALVFLETHEWPKDREDAARRAAALVGEDDSVVASLVDSQPRDERIYEVYEDLMHVASRLSLYVDGMELW